MGWGWLCCAKKRGFVAGFPQILGFFRLLDLKKRPLQNFHFATAPFLVCFIVSFVYFAPKAEAARSFSQTFAQF